MARKKHKKQNEQQKRLQVTDEAGWTHIIKGSRAQKHQRHVSSNEYLKPSEPPEGFTVDKIKEKFHKCCRHWMESESFKNFKLILEEGILASEKVDITRCVCLGLGSLCGREASMYELVFFYTTLEILGTKHQITDVYFQDPVFNSLDEEFLKSLGYMICKTPNAFSKVTANTFLFAPHLEAWSCAKAFEAIHPPLYVGNDMEACVEWLDRDEQWMALSKTYKGYLDRTVSKPMTDFERNNWTHSTCVYWLRLRDDVTANEVASLPEKDQENEPDLTENLDRLTLENPKPEDQEPESPEPEKQGPEQPEPEKPEPDNPKNQEFP